MEKALDIQVGGNHYKGLPYQPVVLATNSDFNFIQGSMLKYVSRYKKKKGEEDLEKVIHYSQLGCELSPINFCNLITTKGNAKEYCIKNEFGDEIFEIIMAIAAQNWLQITNLTGKLIRKEYEAVH